MAFKASDDLREFFPKSEVNEKQKTRVLKICIRNDELILDEQRQVIRKWDEDYNVFVEKLVQKKQPCYLLFRLDSVNNSKQFQWLLIIWIPEKCPKWKKALYYSVRVQLKSIFGSELIVKEYFATNEKEIPLEAYKQWIKRETEGPRDVEAKLFLPLDITSHSVEPLPLQGFQYPLSAEAVDAIKELREGMISYLQFAIDFDQELIAVISKESHNEFDINKFPEKIASDVTRYHIISQQTDENAWSTGLIFICTVAGDSLAKEELFVSCRDALMNAIQDKSFFGFKIDAYIECNDPQELTKAFIVDKSDKSNCFVGTFPANAKSIPVASTKIH